MTTPDRRAAWAEIAEREPGSIVLHRSPTAARAGRSLLFQQPVHVLSAWRPDEVAAALAGIDVMLAQGLYVAGYVAYEAGLALEPALADLACTLPDDEPLVWLGCYRDPLVAENASSPASTVPVALDPRFSLPQGDYEAKVLQVQEWIARGDTYQANLTMDAVWSTEESPATLWHRLLRVQPVPYAALLHPQAGWHVLSLSPELFFKRDGERIVTRPMKGTAAPGVDAAGNRAQTAWLQADEKNRAENVMIVDLLRNDLGRLCQTGSVRVSDLFAVEPYPTVLQMTSTVEGRLRPGMGYAEIFRALFPSGSIVGAPKIHTARLLHALEGRPRGVYTGAIGFMAPDGTAEFNVAIRTVSLRAGRARLGVGSGITSDSVPREEYAECVTKTRFLTRPPEPEFALIETLLLRDGVFPLLEEHLERQAESAEYFGFVCDRARVRAALMETASAWSGAVRVRVLLDRQGGVTCTATALATVDEAIDLLLWPERTCAEDRFLRHKTTQRALYDRAFQHAQANGFGDSLWCNRQGEVTEGAIHNVLVRLEGAWVTPPLDCGVLPGVYRGSLLRQGRVVERRLTLADLLRADAVRMCNAVRGERRVRRLVDGAGDLLWQAPVLLETGP